MEQPTDTKTEADREIEAFFALHRFRLYLYGLCCVALLAAVCGAGLLLARVGHLLFMLFIGPAVGAGTTALLTRSPAGRGCLRTLGLGSRTGRRFAPRTQLWIWLGLSLLGAAVASYVSFAR